MAQGLELIRLRSPRYRHFRQATISQLDSVAANFSETDAEAVKLIETRTNHDVKAVEYWLRERLAKNAEVAGVAQFIHFACTSEDINNLSHGLMLMHSRDRVMLPALDKIISTLVQMAHQLSDTGPCLRALMANPPRLPRLARNLATSPIG